MKGNVTDLAFAALPLIYLATAATAPLLRRGAGWRLTQTGSALALAVAITLPWLALPVSGLFAATPMNLTVTVLVAFICAHRCEFLNPLPRRRCRPGPLSALAAADPRLRGDRGDDQPSWRADCGLGWHQPEPASAADVLPRAEASRARRA